MHQGTSHQHPIRTLTPECCWDYLLGEALAMFKEAKRKIGSDPGKPGLKVTAGTRGEGDKMEERGRDP